MTRLRSIRRSKRLIARLRFNIMLSWLQHTIKVNLRPNQASFVFAFGLILVGCEDVHATIITADDILFIGNSYTFTNDMPGMLAKLGLSGNYQPGFNIEIVAEGGKTLQYHWDEGPARERVRARPWDYVVIQDKSTEPLHSYDEFVDYATRFANAAKENGSIPVLFETWARAEGSDIYKEPWSLGTPSAMQKALRNAYQKVASDTGAVVVPVGDTWEHALGEMPGVKLHDEDKHHPSLLGSFMTACVFYRTLTGQAPTTVPFVPAGLDPKLAEFAKQNAAVDFATEHASPAH